MVEEAGNVGLTPQFQQELPLSSMSLEELSCSIQRQARRKHTVVPSSLGASFSVGHSHLTELL